MIKNKGYSHITRSGSRTKLKLVYVVLALFLISAASATYLIKHKKEQDKKAATAEILKSYSEGTSSKLNSSDSTKDSSSKNGTSAATLPAGQKPTTPYGNFVSNHQPSLSSSSQELSSCSTTSNAKCVITFTKAGESKSLEEKSANNDGAVFWTWDIKDLGLTPGNWDITVKATLNGQTSNTTDARQLAVQP